MKPSGLPIMSTLSLFFPVLASPSAGAVASLLAGDVGCGANISRPPPLLEGKPSLESAGKVGAVPTNRDPVAARMPQKPEWMSREDEFGRGTLV